mmetsp:Transcript_125368/g.279729  ORF Transcript_125368/g.279729 Transcript_125368/m.279729 type:complete len:235 (+) Transcript_125368:1838-2542(+)
MHSVAVLKIVKQAEDVRMAKAKLRPHLAKEVRCHSVLLDLALLYDLHGENVRGSSMCDLLHSAKGAGADGAPDGHEVAELIAPFRRVCLVRDLSQGAARRGALRCGAHARALGRHRGACGLLFGPAAYGLTATRCCRARLCGLQDWRDPLRRVVSLQVRFTEVRRNQGLRSRRRGGRRCCSDDAAAERGSAKERCGARLPPSIGPSLRRLPQYLRSARARLLMLCVPSGNEASL